VGRTSEEDKWGGEKQQKEDLGREGGGREGGREGRREGVLSIEQKSLEVRVS
jgi:hypothetical protein